MAQQQNENLNQMPTNENSFMNDVTGKNFPQNGNNIDATNNKHVPNMSDTQKGKPAVPNNGNGSTGMPPTHNDGSNMHLGPYPHPMQHHHMPPELEQQHQQQVCAPSFFITFHCASFMSVVFLLSRIREPFSRCENDHMCSVYDITKPTD